MLITLYAILSGCVPESAEVEITPSLTVSAFFVALMTPPQWLKATIQSRSSGDKDAAPSPPSPLRYGNAKPQKNSFFKKKLSMQERDLLHNAPIKYLRSYLKRQTKRDQERNARVQKGAEAL